VVIAALACAVLRPSGAGIGPPPWPGSRRFPARACRWPACLPHVVPGNVYG